MMTHVLSIVLPTNSFKIMATRSRIGIQLSDESVLSVYHHWDNRSAVVGSYSQHTLQHQRESF